MIERWSRDQVLALAPDASSQKAAQGVSAAGKWPVRGTTGTLLYGECKGSGARPYLACVDLTEPAYRCSCPSRKFPCKHALGLLLLWSAGEVLEERAAPQWATEWAEARAERAAKAAAKIEAIRARNAPDTTADQPAATSPEPAAADVSGRGATDARTADSAGPAPETAATGHGACRELPLAASDEGGGGSGEATPGIAGASDGGLGGSAPEPIGAGGAGPSREASRVEGTPARHARVAAGLGELERWLADQLRQGLAQAAEHEWEGLAKRLIDAQAPGVAGVVSRLARVRADDDWPGRLLEEYALLHLLAAAYRRRSDLPAPLADTVLIRVGFPVTREEVLAGPVVRDQWDVLGRRDDVQDQLTARRVWLRGRHTGRAALVLSFAPPGQALDASLVTGTVIDADLAYYPGAAPLRALVAARRDPSQDAPTGGAPPGVPPEEALDEVAGALAEDPWTESWPLVLAGVVPGRSSIGGLPLHPAARDPWRLIAVSGGRPLTVAAEWTPRGLRPLTTWDDDDRAVIL
ncbi:SWIM zinc finger family protein [Nonomuraea phyllanthi]|uniref:SWIM zinc finger family protein n=1 Tax=Nonomuraea phyllanthi TaxID=2219224 RepID=UPI001D15760F|nr:SWIM zinc finger family protein [Nonomuraea phyllanthi]